MDGPSHYPGAGNLSRHQETFNDVMYSHLKRTPWWLISMAAHGALVLVLFAATVGPDYSDQVADVTAAFLDGSLKVSLASAAIVTLTSSAVYRIDGSLGEEAIAWLDSLHPIPVPDPLLIKPPVWSR